MSGAVVNKSTCPLLLTRDLSALLGKAKRPSGRRFAGFGFGLRCSLRKNGSRSRRGGKGGISRLWRDFQGSVGAGENLPLVFAGFHAPAFSTALFAFRFDQRCPRAAIPPHDVRAEADGDCFIQMLVDRHRAACQAVAESRLLDLPRATPDRDRVVLLYDPLRLYAEDPVQVAPAGPPKRRPFRRRRHAELAVELRDVAFP